MSQNVQMFVINSSSDVHISCISVSNLTEIFYNFILCHLESFLDISSTFALFHQFECVYLSYLLLKCSLNGIYHNYINSQIFFQSHFRDLPLPRFEDFGAFTVFVGLSATGSSISGLLS